MFFMFQGLEWWSDFPQDAHRIHIGLVHPAMINGGEKLRIIDSQQVGGCTYHGPILVVIFQAQNMRLLGVNNP